MAAGSNVFPMPDIIAPILLIGAIGFAVIAAAPKGQRPRDEEWKGGVFYSNRSDRALLVPKRFGVGYTLNFGNPWAWALLVLILFFAAAPLFLTWMLLGHLRR